MFDDCGERLGEPARRLRIGTAEGAGHRLARLEHGERFGLPHRRRDRIDHRHRNAVADLCRESGERRARQDDDVGVVLLDRAVGERDQQFLLLSACTCEIDWKRPSSARMPAQRAFSPCMATHSSYQGASAPAKVTIANRRPSMQAVSIAASANPTTGKANSSRAPNRPGSPNAAITAASTPGAASASISSAIAPPIWASARVAI
ncbi:hypothetical protein ABIF25_006155 [Bradyrhizobium elkanii]